MPVGVYPGSFNPPTVAHLAIAEAAATHAGLERVDLVLSEVALGKEDAFGPSVGDRLAVLEAVAASRPWIGARRSPHRLVADLAEGYDAVVMGADKWAQVLDPSWYGGSAAARDRAVRLLPPVLVVPRPGHPLTPEDVAPGELLVIDPRHGEVSSSGVRAGRVEWMLPEAAELARRTGAWSTRRGGGSTSGTRRRSSLL